MVDITQALRVRLDFPGNFRESPGLDPCQRRIREDFRETLEERALVAEEARAAAAAACDRAERLVLSIFQQLCGERRVWLASGGRGLQELDLVETNIILARHGLRLRSERGYSERLVKTKTAESTWQARSRFWLEAIAGRDVAIDVDDDHQIEGPITS